MNFYSGGNTVNFYSGGHIYTTTPARLQEARKFFKENPTKRVKIPLPGWFDLSWNKEDFDAWFMACLHAKINRNSTCNGRKFTSEYQADLQHDARIINDYYGRRIRHSGRNILNTPEMKARYPDIDNPDDF